MSRIAPPSPYVSWNVYIKDQTDGIADPVARKLAKRHIKLDLIASVERHADGNELSPSYRIYDIYEHPGTFSPTPHRPWQSEATDSMAQILLESGEYLGTEDLVEITAEGPEDTPYTPAPPFALTETVNTAGASIVETNVGPLTLAAKATSYQVFPPEDGYISVNGITIKTTTMGSRGHTLAVISPVGATVGTITTYDTFESAPGDGGAAARTALTSALNAVASGNYIVLTSWDACSWDAGLRSALNTGFGTTLSTTWTATRYSHIVIAQKI